MKLLALFVIVKLMSLRKKNWWADSTYLNVKVKLSLICVFVVWQDWNAKKFKPNTMTFSHWLLIWLIFWQNQNVLSQSSKKKWMRLNVNTLIHVVLNWWLVKFFHLKTKIWLKKKTSWLLFQIKDTSNVLLKTNFMLNAVVDEVFKELVLMTMTSFVN